MIIDKILDRKDGHPYTPKDLYDYCTADFGNGNQTGGDIASALDGGTETDVKKELSRYIINNEYNPTLVSYIWSVEWL
jgi:hypothetical protein